MIISKTYAKYIFASTLFVITSYSFAVDYVDYMAYNNFNEPVIVTFTVGTHDQSYIINPVDPTKKLNNSVTYRVTSSLTPKLNKVSATTLQPGGAAPATFIPTRPAALTNKIFSVKDVGGTMTINEEAS